MAEDIHHSPKEIGRPEVVFGAIALITALFLALLLYLWLGWQAYLVWLLGCNLTTFLFFRYDKRLAAQAEATRVPELILHLLVLAGGFIGGWLGMFLRPRHKVRKPIFWVVLITGTLLHLYLIFALIL
jgi:uncharacterized membrane protein YsdA (DUF1294 family)